MKKIYIILLLSGLFLNVHSQNYLHLSGGYSNINPDQWNRTISAYNFARPWLKNELPAIHNAWSYGFGYSGVIARGLFLSPEINYSRYSSSSTNNTTNVDIKINWLRASLYIDLYPMEFKLDSVGARIRPFIRLGGGASSLIPRISMNDSLTTVDDKLYKPYVWSYQLTAGLGCRFNIVKHIDLIPVFLLNYQPSVNLEDFSYAVQGNQILNLSDKQKIINPQFLLTLSIRIGRSEETRAKL